MTPKEFESTMKEFNDIHDTDDRHMAMDELMCFVLRDLGYKDGVDIFEASDKWYA